VIGFDLIKPKSFPAVATFVQQDIATMVGESWRGRVSLIVASPPCTEFTQVWRFAKHRKPDPATGMEVVRHCFRLASESGCPLVLENVMGAREFFEPEYGPSTWHVGPYYFWGWRPVLIPQGLFVKGVWNTNPQTPTKGARVLKRRGKAYVRDRAERARIPLEIGHAVGTQFRQVMLGE
jgi:hypothetical protein